MSEVYQADPSLKGKLRRRLARLVHRRPAGPPPRPMVTFSFDDAPASAAETGARLLEAHGLRGTFYISAGLAGTDGPMGRIADMDEVQRLEMAGHEVACHTLTHLDCGRAGHDTIVADAKANRDALSAANLPAPVSFAYPYGDVSPAAKRALGGAYLSLRALHHGIVTQGSDLNQAPAVGIEGSDGEDIAGQWLDRVAQTGGWLILYTHDVQDAPSAFGCTPAALGRLIDKAQALGLETVTAAEGAARLAAR